MIEATDSDAILEGWGAGPETAPFARAVRPRGADALRGVRNQVAEMGGDVFIDAGWDGTTLQAEAYDCGTEEATPTRVGV